MNEDYLKQVKEMFEVDQDLRYRFRPGREIPNYLVYISDIFHNYKIRFLINQYGYPSEKLIGKEGMEYFNCLIVHQFDIKLQQDFIDNCDVSPQIMVSVIDRIRYNKGEKQLYGTLNIEMEDEKNVDKRRKELGLNPLAEYLDDLKKESAKMEKRKEFDYYKIK